MQTLEQIAQQAMDYLDSVGVAADYDIANGVVEVETDKGLFRADSLTSDLLITQLRLEYLSEHPQKSPA